MQRQKTKIQQLLLLFSFFLLFHYLCLQQSTTPIAFGFVGIGITTTTAAIVKSTTIRITTVRMTNNDNDSNLHDLNRLYVQKRSRRRKIKVNNDDDDDNNVNVQEYSSTMANTIATKTNTPINDNAIISSTSASSSSNVLEHISEIDAILACRSYLQKRQLLGPWIDAIDRRENRYKQQQQIVQDKIINKGTSIDTVCRSSATLSFGSSNNNQFNITTSSNAISKHNNRSHASRNRINFKQELLSPVLRNNNNNSTTSTLSTTSTDKKTKRGNSQSNNTCVNDSSERHTNVVRNDNDQNQDELFMEGETEEARYDDDYDGMDFSENFENYGFGYTDNNPDNDNNNNYNNNNYNNNNNDNNNRILSIENNNDIYDNYDDDYNEIENDIPTIVIPAQLGCSTNPLIVPTFVQSLLLSSSDDNTNNNNFYGSSNTNSYYDNSNYNDNNYNNDIDDCHNYHSEQNIYYKIDDETPSVQHIRRSKAARKKWEDPLWKKEWYKKRWGVGRVISSNNSNYTTTTTTTTMASSTSSSTLDVYGSQDVNMYQSTTTVLLPKESSSYYYTTVCQNHENKNINTNYNQYSSAITTTSTNNNNQQRNNYEFGLLYEQIMTNIPSSATPMTAPQPATTTIPAMSPACLTVLQSDNSVVDGISNSGSSCNDIDSIVDPSTILANMKEEEIEYAITSYIEAKRKRIQSRQRTLQQRKQLLVHQYEQIQSLTMNRIIKNQTNPNVPSSSSGILTPTISNTINIDPSSFGPAETRTAISKAEELQRIRSERAKRAYQTRLQNIQSTKRKDKKKTTLYENRNRYVTESDHGKVRVFSDDDEEEEDICTAIDNDNDNKAINNKRRGSNTTSSSVRTLPSLANLNKNKDIGETIHNSIESKYKKTTALPNAVYLEALERIEQILLHIKSYKIQDAGYGSSSSSTSTCKAVSTQRKPKETKAMIKKKSAPATSSCSNGGGGTSNLGNQVVALPPSFLHDIECILIPSKLYNRRYILRQILSELFNLRGKCVPPLLSSSIQTVQRKDSSNASNSRSRKRKRETGITTTTAFICDSTHTSSELGFARTTQLPPTETLEAMKSTFTTTTRITEENSPQKLLFTTQCSIAELGSFVIEKVRERIEIQQH